MPLEIKFDTAGNIEQPTLVLAYRNGNKIGVLSDVESLVIRDSFGNPIELSFTVYKKICPKIWDYILDFRSIYVKEWDRWFQIHIEVKEGNTETKFVTATHLPEAELSQLNIYTTEINTESDIERDDYEDTIFFNEENPNASLLHRISKKAINFKFIHVDASLKNIWRQFSFDKVSIYDAFLEIAEEVHCLFVYGTEVDKETGRLWRTISVYDLEDSCEACLHREETMDECPECGSKYINKGYGLDTTVFLSTDNVLDEVNYSSNVDSVKNCFKLEAGDDLMTAAVMACNPTGSDYIWVHTMKEDMSESLISALDEYELLYNKYYKEVSYGTEEFPLNVDTYNEIVGLYSTEPFENTTLPVEIPLIGHSKLMELYYDTIDMYLYLDSGLMPIPSMEDTTAEEQAELVSEIETVAVSSQTGLTSINTVEASVRTLAEAMVDPRYKIVATTTSLEASEWEDPTTKKKPTASVWKGTITVTNRSDEEQTTTTDTLTVRATTDYETFVKQKIDKALAKGEDIDYSISGIFKLDNTDWNVDGVTTEFEKEMQKYALTSLERYRDSCTAVINVLTEQGVGNPNNFNLTDPNNDLYNKIYIPYFNKLQVIEAEILKREEQISVVEILQKEIETITGNVASFLNLENFLGEELWAELNLFRREDTYSNSNYISDGLDNAEIFKQANEFLKVANREINKSATLQHSISVSTKNIFTIKEFEPMRKGFSVGNWLRVQADGKVYKLRLLSYELDFSNYENMTVEFSDVEYIQNDIEDIKNTISTMNTMATSFSYVEHQALKSAESSTIVRSFIDDGLDMTLTKIMNNATGQTQTWDGNGMLFRSYDEITEEYSPEQLKIINSTVAITDTNWNSVKTAIGKFIYYDPLSQTYKEGFGINGEVLVGKVIIGETLTMANEDDHLTFNKNGLTVYNDTNKVSIDPKSSSILTVKNTKNDTDLLSFDEEGNLSITGTIYATDGEFTGDVTANTLTANEAGSIAGWTINPDVLYSGGTGLSSNSSKYAFWAGETNNKLGIVDTNGSNAVFSVTHSGKLSATDVDITGVIEATSIIIEDKLQIRRTSDNIVRDVLRLGISEADEAGRSYTQIEIGAFANFSDNSVTINAAHVIADGEITLGETSVLGDLSCWSFETDEINTLYLETDELIVSGVTELKGDTTIEGEVFMDQPLYFSEDVYNDKATSKTANVRLCDVGGRHTGYSRLAQVNSSSIRYKNIIENFSVKDFPELYNLPTYWFKYKDGYLMDEDERANKQIPGFIVEDWEKFLPIAIDHNLDGSPEMWNSNIVTPIMFEMIKDTHSDVVSNIDKIHLLEQKIEYLEQQIKQLTTA